MFLSGLIRYIPQLADLFIEPYDRTVDHGFAGAHLHMGCVIRAVTTLFGRLNRWNIAAQLSFPAKRIPEQESLLQRRLVAQIDLEVHEWLARNRQNANILRKHQARYLGGHAGLRIEAIFK